MGRNRIAGGGAGFLPYFKTGDATPAGPVSAGRGDGQRAGSFVSFTRVTS
ncbi:hypothetical protein GCM10010109_21110 [Actinoplanes campanulatus]|nr:hypothetical protein GCM10010109_21110 [Actinoplanes campanulatus]GID36627.1 hypothetical protein Aca09nite_31330 [Actinoplanes campanulatus]